MIDPRDHRSEEEDAIALAGRLVVIVSVLGIIAACIAALLK